MEILTTVTETRERVFGWRRQGLSVGFVPTMGALHAGHLSLLRRARQECDRVVASIFVNPLQFGQNEDFDSYPRNLEADAALAQGVGCDLIFAPSVEEMYPEEIRTVVSVSGLSEGLCGSSRPGHFDGVATVVAKLFNIVTADRAYFGRKDAQQLAVIKKMARDLDFPVTVVGCPTVREADGLACSSRNAYLEGEARSAALCLYRGLRAASRLVSEGERRADVLERAVMAEVQAEPLATLDYAELRDWATMAKLDRLPEDGEAILAVAAYISNPPPASGKARLIDNVFIAVEQGKVTVDEGVVAAGGESAAALDGDSAAATPPGLRDGRKPVAVRDRERRTPDKG